MGKEEGTLVSNNRVVVATGGNAVTLTSDAEAPRNYGIALSQTEIHVRLSGPQVIVRALESLLHEHHITSDNDDASILVLVPPCGVPHPAQLRAAQRQAGSPAVACDQRRKGYVLLTDGSDISERKPHWATPCSLVGTDDDVASLIAGIEAAARGESYCSPSLLTALIQNACDLPRNQAAAGYGDIRSTSRTDNGINSAARANDPENPRQIGEPLSRREREITQHAATGLSNEEIADSLHISVATVKFHLFHAFRKLGIVRRSQIAASIGYVASAGTAAA